MATKAQAKLVLEKALQNGGNLDIVTSSEKAAISLRFLLYKARVEDREEKKKVLPPDWIGDISEYDCLEFTVEGTVVKIRSESLDLVYINPLTGEEL